MWSSWLKKIETGRIEGSDVVNASLANRNHIDDTFCVLQQTEMARSNETINWKMR